MKKEILLKQSVPIHLCKDTLQSKKAFARCSGGWGVQTARGAPQKAHRHIGASKGIYLFNFEERKLIFKRKERHLAQIRSIWDFSRHLELQSVKKQKERTQPISGVRAPPGVRTPQMRARSACMRFAFAGFFATFTIIIILIIIFILFYCFTSFISQFVALLPPERRSGKAPIAATTH